MLHNPTSMIFPDLPTGFPTSQMFPSFSFIPPSLFLPPQPPSLPFIYPYQTKRKGFTGTIEAEVERAYGCVLKLNLSEFPFLKGVTISIRSSCVDAPKVVKRANKIGKTPQQSDYELEAWIEVEHYNYNYIGNQEHSSSSSSSSRVTREVLKRCCSEKCKPHDGIAFFRTFAFVVGQSNSLEEELPMIFYGAPSHDRRGKKAKFVLRMRLYENGVVLSESEDMIVPYKQSITVKQRNQQLLKSKSGEEIGEGREMEAEVEVEGGREARDESQEGTEGRNKKSRGHGHRNQLPRVPSRHHQKRRKTGPRSESAEGEAENEENENSDICSPLLQSNPSSPSLSQNQQHKRTHQSHPQTERRERRDKKRHHQEVINEHPLPQHQHQLEQQSTAFRTLSANPSLQHSMPFYNIGSAQQYDLDFSVLSAPSDNNNNIISNSSICSNNSVCENRSISSGASNNSTNSFSSMRCNDSVHTNLGSNSSIGSNVSMNSSINDNIVVGNNNLVVGNYGVSDSPFLPVVNTLPMPHISPPSSKYAMDSLLSLVAVQMELQNSCNNLQYKLNPGAFNNFYNSFCSNNFNGNISHVSHHNNNNNNNKIHLSEQYYHQQTPNSHQFPNPHNHQNFRKEVSFEMPPEIPSNQLPRSHSQPIGRNSSDFCSAFSVAQLLRSESN